jgi:hypothetical protein
MRLDAVPEDAMTRWLVAFAVLCLPGFAFAAVGAEQSTTGLIVQAVTLAVNAYIAAEIAPLKRTVRALKRDVAALKHAHGGIIE